MSKLFAFLVIPSVLAISSCWNKHPVDGVKEVNSVAVLITGDSIAKGLGKTLGLNTAISGITTQILLDRWFRMVEVHNPKKIILHIGVNDLILNIDINTTIYNLEKLNALCRDRCVFMVTPYWSYATPEQLVNGAKLNNFIRSNTGFIDYYYWSIEHFMDDYNSGDGLHPSQLGSDDLNKIILKETLCNPDTCNNRHCRIYTYVTSIFNKLCKE